MNRNEHWNTVYETKSSDSVSWYQAEPAPSLCALERFEVQPSAALIDVGGGASNLVDALLQRGWSDLTVLDIAAPALEVAKARLGADAAKAAWEVADITAWSPRRAYDVWHDRAVFHFLTEPDQRAAYRAALASGLAADGLLIMATFALDGPERCSRLQVQHYDVASLACELGSVAELVDSWEEQHITPGGGSQAFNWCAFRRRWQTGSRLAPLSPAGPDNYHTGSYET